MSPHAVSLTWDDCVQVPVNNCCVWIVGQASLGRAGMREGAAAEVLTPCLAPLAFALEAGDGGARGRAVPGVLYRGTCPCGVLGLPGGLPMAGRDVSRHAVQSRRACRSGLPPGAGVAPGPSGIWFYGA